MKISGAIVKRFWNKVNKKGPVHPILRTRCWVWTASTSGGGYSQFQSIRGVNYGHVASWMIHYEELIPEGVLVCHKCDNPICVRPDHLFLGTHQDNMDDMVQKGRQQKGDLHFSRLTPERVVRGDKHWARRSPEKVARGDRHGSKTHPERVPRGDRNGLRKHPEKAARGDDHYSRRNPELMSRGKVHSEIMKIYAQRGEKRYNAKLTDEIVRWCRIRYAQGGISITQLAEMFGISRMPMWQAIRRQTWKHVK